MSKSNGDILGSVVAVCLWKRSVEPPDFLINSSKDNKYPNWALDLIMGGIEENQYPSMYGNSIYSLGKHSFIIYKDLRQEMKDTMLTTLKCLFRVWRDGSVVKYSYCSCRMLGIDS